MVVDAYSQQARVGMGFCYDNGEGLERDQQEAVQWYRLAAEQSYSNAQFTLGLCYKNNGDDREAVRWFRAAANQNDARAQNSLGLCYKAGEGVEKNEVEAVRWLRLASRFDERALYNMGNCYRDGVGVEESHGMAACYFHITAEISNHQMVKKAYSKAVAKLSPVWALSFFRVNFLT
jgi:TPR repeat protein